MSQTFERVRYLVAREDVKVSDHGYDELAEDGILAGEAISGIHDGVVVEDYPEYAKGPCVLVLEHDSQGQPIHVLWGIPRGKEGPAVLITAYRPEPDRWSEDFTRRKR